MGVHRQRCACRAAMVLTGVALAAAGILPPAAAKDYETGPTWVYARGDGSKTFGEVEYCLESGYPAATLNFSKLKPGDVAAYRLPNDYAALSIGGTQDVVVVRLYSERGEDCAVGVFRVKFADGTTWSTRRRQDSTPYKGQALEHVKELRGLPLLSLSGMKLTETDFARLKELSNLRVLNLMGTNLTDADLKHLTGLTRLRRLSVVKTKVTDAGLKELRKALPNLKIIR